MFRQPLLHGFGTVEPAIVTHHPNLASGVPGNQHNQERQKLSSAFTLSDGICQLASFIVNSAVDHGLLVLARGRDLRLSSEWCPHSSQCGMTMYFHFVLEDQDFVSIVGDRFFFSLRSLIAAF